MRDRARCVTAIVCGLVASVGWAEIGGQVVNSRGVAVEAAQVVAGLAEGGTQATSTDSGGYFRLAVEPPVVLQVLHPRYELIEREFTVAPVAPVVFELVPKQELYEEIVVAASRSEGDAPVSIAATAITPEEVLAPAATLGDLVSSLAGVAENGQGGIFQTYSIRGISGQRVQSMIDGMRIVGERRAGVSVSFIDPELLETVHVLRGPSSSYYGSGALGGVIQALPRSYDGLRVAAGYESQGDANHQKVGWGDGEWSLAFAHRRAENAETPRGEELNSGFRQYNAMLERGWTAGGLGYRLQAIATEGRDIGKSNTDFPDEVSSYPAEDHLLLRFSLQKPGVFEAEAYVHPNELETRVADTASGARAEVFNEAFDFGGRWQQEVRDLAGGSARFGIDLFGRRGVTAREVDTPGGGAPQPAQATLHDGEEDEAGLYGASEWSIGRATALVGARFAWQRQSNAGGRSEDDAAWGGFAGVVAPLGGGFELAANAGTGLRFPSLSERFFTGATGRGQVLGNPDLESERSVALDLGLRYYGRRLFVTGALFRTEIDDYVERINVTPDLRTFVNLIGGTLEGAELTGQMALDSWSVGFGGHVIEGRSESGAPLADAPADRVHASVGWMGERWGVDGRWEHRFEKSDAGSGEQPIGAADVVSMAVSLAWRDGVSLRLTGRNLLDEEYFNSADEQLPLSAGRSVGISVAYEP
jgi:iron complex outermembrane receptor protein